LKTADKTELIQQMMMGNHSIHIY